MARHLTTTLGTRSALPVQLVPRWCCPRLCWFPRSFGLLRRLSRSEPQFRLRSPLTTRYIAHRVAGIYKSEIDFITAQRKLALGLALLRLFVYTGGGIAVLVFSRPLSKIFTKGLESLNSD